jgi:hypothetical protein
VPLYERVEKAIINILNRKVEVSFDEVLQEIFLTFPNARTPDKSNIVEVIEEYASKARQGKWKLKPIFTHREGEHSRAIFTLGEIGRKLGYNIWIGVREQSDSFSKTILRDLCTTKTLTMPDITDEAMNRIRNIDVLWYTEKIEAEFEVENSTGITEAIVRGANIPYEIARFIVVPEERENLLQKRMAEPALKGLIIGGGWRLIFYTRLFDFYDVIKHHRGIKHAEFDKVIGEKAAVTEKGQRKML